MAQLSGGEPVLEGIYVAGSAFAFQSCQFRFVPGGKIHFLIAVSLWQSYGKVEKINCDFLCLDPL
jgi:hypothetical protein